MGRLMCVFKRNVPYIQMMRARINYKCIKGQGELHDSMSK